MTKPIISLVVAVTRNGVIGRDGDLPWRLSSDLKRFKSLTLGKPVVMGRKCYASIAKPLPGRPNIVITRDQGFSGEGLHIAHSFDEGMAIAEALATKVGVEEVCVIGGGEIYRLAMPFADMLHVTHIDTEIDGDAHFPLIDPLVWDGQDEGSLPAGEKDDFAMRFVTYRRRPQ
jgi:dihydrofolate reductase